MTLFAMRSITATALSLWLGVLACLLGCAKPAAASTQRPSSEASMTTCPTGGDADDSCCQHGHGSSDGSDKSSHHAKSCCPTETALTQRDSTSVEHAVSLHVDALALPAINEPSVTFVRTAPAVPTLWQAGRDILRQVHVLRI
ncbi:MAG TPA: hypothetical protein VHP80_19955 [Candidatus Acidoferrum sp.]|nr:hypothetical protein [Candidatus Acidoferrum sp.]